MMYVLVYKYTHTVYTFLYIRSFYLLDNAMC